VAAGLVRVRARVRVRVKVRVRVRVRVRVGVRVGVRVTEGKAWRVDEWQLAWLGIGSP
jgi:hypothetical protein